MIFFLIIFFYVIGVLICGVLLLCAINDRYENELVYIDTTYNDILDEEIKRVKLKNTRLIAIVAAAIATLLIIK